MQKSICATNEVRFAIFAWIFARYWNGVTVTHCDMVTDIVQNSYCDYLEYGIY